MACEKAQKFVEDYVRENDLPLSADQVADLVQACCDDVTSQACADALATVAASTACNVYTEGACVPCCNAVGGVVGPIIGRGIGIAVGFVKGVYETVSGWFGGGGCDFDGAANQIVAGYAQATRELGIAMEQAWNDARAALELEPRGVLFCKDGPGGLWVPLPSLQADVMGCMGKITTAGWLEALMHNAAVFSYAAEAHGGRVWTVKGKPGFLTMPPVEPNQDLSPERLFYFWWDSWQCSQPNNWQNSALDVTAYRWTFVKRAAERLARDMTVSLSREAKVKSMEIVRKMVLQRPTLPVAVEVRRPQAEPSSESRPLVAVGIVGAAGLGGYIAWRLLRAAS